MSTQEYSNVNKRGVISYLIVYLFVLSVFHVRIDSGFSEARFDEFQNRLLRCCRFLPGATNLTSARCAHFKKILKKELDRQVFLSSKSYRYTRRLWKSIAKITEQEEDNDASLIYWTVNATKADIIGNQHLVFKQFQISQQDQITNTGQNDTLTRLELLIPYYFGPRERCRQEKKDHEAMYISVNGRNISTYAGLVSQSNILVFQLPLELYSSSEGCHTTNVSVKQLPNHVIPHLKNAMLLRYYNINETSFESIKAMAEKQSPRKKNSIKENKSNNDNDEGPKSRKRRSSETLRCGSKHMQQKGSIDNGEQKRRPCRPGRGRIKRQGRVKQGRQDKKQTNKQKVWKSSSRKHFCQLHKYKVKFYAHLKMRWVVQPREINLGDCRGRCDVLSLDKTSSTYTARSVFLNFMTEPPRGQRRINSTCVPDKMKSVLLMLFDHSTLTLKSHPGAIIQSCRCV